MNSMIYTWYTVHKMGQNLINITNLLRQYYTLCTQDHIVYASHRFPPYWLSSVKVRNNKNTPFKFDNRR